MSDAEMNQLMNAAVGVTIVYIVVAVVHLLLVIWALIDVARRPLRESSIKPLWVLAILFIPLIGAITYLCSRRSITANVRQSS